MVQDAVLLETTQHELRHSVSLRKRKLQELYRVTCATADALWRCNNNVASSPPSRKTTDESDFIDANDVEKGRFFDVVTLRRLPGAAQLFQPDSSGPVATEPISKPQHDAPPLHQPTSVPVSGNSSVSNRPGEDTVTGLPVRNGTTFSSLKTPISPGSDGTKESTAVLKKEPVENHVKGDKKSAIKTETSFDQVNGAVPATPPAEIQDGKFGNKEHETANASSKASVSSEQQLNSSTPESQLLFETAQSQTRGSVLPSSTKAIETPKSHVTSAEKPTNAANASAEAAAKLGAQTESTPSRLNTERSPKPGLKYPMQIDTSITRQQPSNSYAASATSTPPVSANPGAASPPERMRTRVYSGAIRHKSVSEILGETPRASGHERTPSIDKAVFSPVESSFASRRQSQASTTPDTSTFNRRLSDLRDKEKIRSQLSTVVFTKPQGDHHDNQARNALQLKKGLYDGIDDYLLPLFLAQAGHQELMQLINSSRKSLSTSDFHLYIRELMNCRLLKKIYVMQNNHKWSLRQHEREPEPERPATHWDALLAEMKWMRTDFREERKWKLSVARNLAMACADWVSASSEQRQAMQVKVKQPAMKGKINGSTPESGNGMVPDSDDSVPDLIASNDDETSEEAEEDMQVVLSTPLPPAAVFSLGADDISFGMDQTPVGEKLLSELPLYDPLAALRKRIEGVQNDGIDGTWRKNLATVSKWNDSRIVYSEEPPRKRRKTSRFDYAADEEPQENQQPLPPEQSDVAMFRSENRHLMHRLHQTHAFRMPIGSEFPLPSQSFFEYRQSSQWTREDDEQLRRRVREYAFNWSLISQTMSSKSQYTSGADRRTPWECFERWEGMEGIPQEYAKYEFFKRWQSRKHYAEQRQEEQFQAQQQASAAAAHLQPRRRSGKPISVERRKGNRYAGLFQAMSRYAKKKEAQQAKQQQMATVAAQRKHSEPQQSQKRMKTPAEFSAHKHKQELEMIERQKYLRAQYAQKAAMASRSSHTPGYPAMQNVSQMSRPNMPANGTHPHLPSSMVANGISGQGRSLPPGQGMISSMMSSGTRPANLPQNQIQNFRQSQGSTQDSVRLMAEANRMQEQQRLIAQNRQHSNSGTANTHGMTPSMQQQNSMFATMQQQAGKLSPAISGQRPVSSSARAPSLLAGQQLSSGVTPAINHITSELKRRHPTFSDQQIGLMATQQLNMQLQNQRSSANNSMHGPSPTQQHRTPSAQPTAGVHTLPNGQGTNGTFSSQMAASAINAYSAAMRLQTQQQSNGQHSSPQPGVPNAGTSNAQRATPRPESRSVAATPQNRASES